jgi:hypothetical protein
MSEENTILTPADLAKFEHEPNGDLNCKLQRTGKIKVHLPGGKMTVEISVPKVNGAFHGHISVSFDGSKQLFMLSEKGTICRMDGVPVGQIVPFAATPAKPVAVKMQKKKVEAKKAQKIVKKPATNPKQKEVKKTTSVEPGKPAAEAVLQDGGAAA